MVACGEIFNIDTFIKPGNAIRILHSLLAFIDRLIIYTNPKARRIHRHFSWSIYGLDAMHVTEPRNSQWYVYVCGLTINSRSLHLNHKSYMAD